MRYEVVVKNQVFSKTLIVVAEDELTAALRAGAKLGNENYEVIAIRSEKEFTQS